ncbi:MAG: GNAT family N-acetyltransferase [Acidobacteriota bacterium]
MNDTEHETHLVDRPPTVDEYRRLIAAVGWKPRETAAIERGLAGSCFATCAEQGGVVIGMGRVIGDGGLHYYLSDVVVEPACQGRGIGTLIVERLNRWLESLPHDNTHVGVIAVAGSRAFYERLGFVAQSSEGPAMGRWVNEEAPKVR